VADTPSVEGLPVEELAAGLGRWASVCGNPAAPAAIALLVTDGRWLLRPEFRELVWVDDDLAGIDGDELAGLAMLAPGTPGELAVAEVAGSLLGATLYRSLDQVAVLLEPDALALVLQSLAAVGGWARSGRQLMVTGDVTAGHARFYAQGVLL
jgi:hypothetical protein